MNLLFLQESEVCHFQGLLKIIQKNMTGQEGLKK